MLTDTEGHLVWSDVETPAPRPDEIMIEIRAAAINRADLLQRKGTYPSPEGWPAWMGLEVAGTVYRMGEEAARDSGLAVGDRVCALLGGGGYAEYVCAPWGMVMPIPEGLDYTTAAALPEAYATSYLNLFGEGHLQAGQTVFVPAGASGLASVAIPMAKAFGARVITSVLSAEIAAKIGHLGADVVINTAETPAEEVLRAECEAGRPVAVAMDCLGGETLGKCLPYVAEGGYWVVISTLAGVETTVPLRAVLTRRLHVVGSMLRKRTSAEKAEILRELVRKVWPKIEDGTIRPTVWAVMPITRAEEAQQLLLDGKSVGKVVLTV